MSCHRRMISCRAGFSASVELLNSADFSQVIFCQIDVRYSYTALSKTAIAEKNTKMANGHFHWLWEPQLSAVNADITIEGLCERTEHLDIFLFSAHHSMVFCFQCAVY